MKIDVDTSQVDRAFARLAAGAAEDVARVAVATLEADGAEVLDQVRRGARRHHATGRLERFVNLERSGAGIATRITVSASGMVAPLIVGGTRPHPMAPRRARALRLEHPGGELRGFARAVKHPGTRADPFVARGLEVAGASLRSNHDRAASVLADDLARTMREG